jgi:site-specific DNA-methyltransferase (adenine-specific)
LILRKEIIGDATLCLADCRELLPEIEADCVVTDPPYGVTDLEWDRTVGGWAELIRSRQLWCFGSMRFFLGASFQTWTYAQEIVWEKHNGSNNFSDRFRRVHELAVHFYRGEWGTIHKSPPLEYGAKARRVIRKTKPQHWGAIETGRYESEEGGPMLMRSVIYARSMHGSAVHPTQKPVEILRPLIEYSCPPGGLVVDCFGGSFSTGVACLQLGRRFVGIEVDPERFDIGCRNLEDSLRQERLFA